MDTFTSLMLAPFAIGESRTIGFTSPPVAMFRHAPRVICGGSLRLRWSGPVSPTGVQWQKPRPQPLSAERTESHGPGA